MREGDASELAAPRNCNADSCMEVKLESARETPSVIHVFKSFQNVKSDHNNCVCGPVSVHRMCRLWVCVHMCLCLSHRLKHCRVNFSTYSDHTNPTYLQISFTLHTHHNTRNPHCTNIPQKRKNRPQQRMKHISSHSPLELHILPPPSPRAPLSSTPTTTYHRRE